MMCPPLVVAAGVAAGLAAIGYAVRNWGSEPRHAPISAARREAAQKEASILENIAEVQLQLDQHIAQTGKKGGDVQTDLQRRADDQKAEAAKKETDFKAEMEKNDKKHEETMEALKREAEKNDNAHKATIAAQQTAMADRLQEYRNEITDQKEKLKRHLEGEKQKLEKTLAEHKQRAAEHERRVAQEFPKPSWLKDTTRLNFAITGVSGVGKSSLINRVLGVRAARTDVKECTREPTGYRASVEKFGGEVNLWDLPGAGTERHPRDTYIKSMGLRYFDGLLILTASRFTEIDHWLFTEALNWEIPCYLVRNKADNDIESNMADNDMPPQQTVETLLDDLIAHMPQNVCNEYLNRIFVITNRMQKYTEVLEPQYKRLMDMILADVTRERPSVPC